MKEAHPLAPTRDACLTVELGDKALVTRNRKHFRVIPDLRLCAPEGRVEAA